MEEIVLENLTEEQTLVANILINEGRMRATEDLIKYFEEEYYRTATEDPYYGYYVKYVLDVLKEKLEKLNIDG